MMAWKWQFNGVEMDQYFFTSGVQRNIGQNRDLTLTKIGKADGKRFQGVSADEGKIVITGAVLDHLAINRRAIAKVLTTDEPVRVTFSDEPSVYYMAIVEGQSTLEEQLRYGTASITLVVPDAVAHAMSAKTASGTSGQSMSVANAGSAPTAPILTATMSGENGLVAWANDQGGVLQFGSPDEVDGVQHDDTEVVFHYDFKSAPAGVVINKGTINYPNYLGDASRPNKQVGTFSYTNDVAVPVLNRATSTTWEGPSMMGRFPANSQGNNQGNLIWTNRINVATDKAAAGRIEFNLYAGSTLALAMVLHDSNYAVDMLTLDLLCMGQTVWSQNLDRKLFPNGFYNLQMTKFGDQASFAFAKIQSLADGLQTGQTINKSFTMSGLASAAIDSYTTWMAGFADKTGWTINWSDSQFEWANVDYWQEIPNRFKTGDEVIADVATKTVYVNGAEDASLQTVGNMWDSFKLAPGSNSIQPVASSWAKPFAAKIEYREAYV